MWKKTFTRDRWGTSLIGVFLHRWTGKAIKRCVFVPIKKANGSLYNKLRLHTSPPPLRNYFMCFILKVDLATSEIRVKVRNGASVCAVGINKKIPL